MNRIVRFAVIPLLVLFTATGFVRAEEEEGKKERPERPEREKGEHRHGDGEKVEAVFERLDENGDGEITPKELAASPRFEDKDRKDVGAAFKERDLNGDGGITLHEFKKSFHDHHHGKGKKGKKGPRKGGGDGEGKGEGKGKGDGKGAKGGKGGKG